MGGIRTRYVHLGLLSLLIVASLAYLLRPIEDPDLFWHLKTGEWIFQHRGLPETDPFSYTGSGVTTAAARFTLTSYWLSQLLFYGAYALGGWTGIILLRLVVAVVLLGVVWGRRQGDSAIDAVLLTVFAVVFLEFYSMERPQVLSFICFGALLMLLDRLRGSERPSWLRGFRGPLTLALGMLIWSNAHGGHVLGQAAIVTCVLAEGIKFSHRSLRPTTSENYRALLVSGGAGLVGSLVNPNGYHALAQLLPQAGPQGQRVMISEYLSTMEAFTLFREYKVIAIWLLMLLAIAAIASRPKAIDITEVALIVATGYFAFNHMRYVAVFLIVALPPIGRYLSRFGRQRRSDVAAVGLSLVLVVLVVGVRAERVEARRLRTGEWVSRDSFPVAAADFVIASGLSGNMYNEYGWGGYLIWRLAPERKVFSDGRNINPGINWQESVIGLALEQSGQFGWKPLLDRYGVSYVVIPTSEGRDYTPLFKRLFGDPEWALLFNRENASVFARRTSLRGGA